MAPRASREVFEEDVYERDRYPSGSRRARLVEEDIDYRRHSGPPIRELERLRVRDRSAPDFLREDYTRSRDAGPLVVKREREHVEFRPRERPRPREVDREEIRIIDEERERDRRRTIDRDVERDEIRIRRRDRSLPPLEREREEYILRRDKRSPAQSEYDQDEVIFRRSNRDGPRESEWERDEVRYRTPSRHRSRSRHRSSDKEEIIIRKDERGGGHKRSDSEKDEIIIRRKEERSSSEEPPAPIDPPPIRAPPIHQEVITHHRHIDHGFEVPPPRVRSPEFRSPRDSFEEVKIHERGERNGRPYHDDIIFDRRERDDSPPRLRRRSSAYYDRREEDEVVVSRRRPRSLDREREIVIRERDRRSTLDRRDERDIEEEADYYNRLNAERSYIGEAYNGATRAWSIIDVPPGTKRVTMDGIGGASQEISWQRYNGVRRSRFITDGEEIDEEPDRDVGRIGRRYVGAKDRHEKLWTEITKDLVVREAIERSGYEFEETDFFYYIFAYLRYDDIAALVDLSDDIRRARRERIHEIHRERASLPPPPAPLPVRTPLMLERPPPPRPRPWEEERVSEHDLIIEERRPGRGRW